MSTRRTTRKQTGQERVAARGGTLGAASVVASAVPNLATSPFTREGFVTAKVTATVEGAGNLSINSGFLVLGVQLGCQVDVSEGLELGVDPEVDIFNFDSDSGSFEDPEVDVWPEVDTKLHAGNIEVVGLGAKIMKSRTATISVRDAHVEVSECSGPVTVRMFASATISTDSSDDSLNAYGAPSAYERDGFGCSASMPPGCRTAVGAFFGARNCIGDGNGRIVLRRSSRRR